MKQIFLDKISERLTARRATLNNDVLFFTRLTSGTFCFAAYAQADTKA